MSAPTSDSLQPVRFSVVTSASGLLTKTFRRNPQGGVEKVVSAPMSRGHLDVVASESPQHLAALIRSLRTNQALMFGGPKSGVTSTPLVSRAARSRGEEGLTRTNEDMDYLDGPGLLFLDFDRLPAGATLEAISALLGSVAPALAQAPMVVIPSASSYIVDTTTNETMRGLTGVHVYVWLERARDAPAIGAALRDRFVLAGFGWAFVSEAGVVDVRVPFDTSVHQPTRFAFAAGANCEPPLIQRRGEPLPRNPTGRPLRFDDVPPLSEEERVELARIEGGIRAGAEAERQRKRAAYRESRIAAGVPAEALDRMLESHELEGDFPVTLADGASVTVADILADPDRYHGKDCLDPEEPSYQGSKVVGKVYAKNDDGLPRIHSFAHGGRVFTLVADAATRERAASEDFTGVSSTIRTPTAASVAERLGLVPFGTIEDRRVEWLLPGRLARQQITMLNGWPGEGKTSVAIDIVAKLSRGLGLIDGTKPPGPLRILVLSTEDSQTVLKNRLRAAGADLNRVFTVPDTKLNHLTLPSQRQNWVALLREMGVDLVVIDPMMAFVDDDLKSIAEQDARKFALALRQVCEEANVAALCIRHPNKATAGGSMNPVSASSGSLAFTAAARIELLVGRLPDSDEKRALVHVKNNLAAAPPALLYHITQAQVDFIEGQESVAAVEWLGVDRTIAAEDLLARRESREHRTLLDEAKTFLEKFLADGPVAMRSVRAAAKERGIKDRTLDRAREQVGWTDTHGNFRSGGVQVWGLNGQTIEDFKPEPAGSPDGPADLADVGAA